MKTTLNLIPNWISLTSNKQAKSIKNYFSHFLLTEKIKKNKPEKHEKRTEKPKPRRAEGKEKYILKILLE